MSWFSSAINAVWRTISSIWKKVSPEIEQTLTNFLTTFADAAFKAVANAALTSLTGSQKMSQVLDELKGEVKSAGWVAGETALRMLAETAYAAFKASKGDILVAPPGFSNEDLAKVGM